MLRSVVLVLIYIFTCTVSLSAEEISVGIIAPLTGLRSDAGNYIKNGVELAVGEVNSSSKYNFKFKVLYEDSKYSAKESVTAFRKLKNISKVDFIIGPYSSSSVLAVAPLAEETNTLLIIPGAQSDEISEAGDNIFRLIHNARQEAPFFAEEISKRMKSDTLHLLVLQTAFTYSYLKHFKPALKKHAKKIGLIEEYAPEATDFRSHLLRIKEKKPTDIFLFATPLHAGHILKQAAEISLNVQFYNIGVEGPELLELAGKHAEGLLYPYSYDVDSKQPEILSFTKSYYKQYKSEPDTVAANSYDGVKLLADCINSYGVDVSKVKDCFYAVDSFAGASGTFKIDEQGDAVKKLLVKQIRNGKYTRADS